MIEDVCCVTHAALQDLATLVSQNVFVTQNRPLPNWLYK